MDEVADDCEFDEEEADEEAVHQGQVHEQLVKIGRGLLIRKIKHVVIIE